jgi:hypothetical protein
MASHVNLYTLLGNASNQYITGSGINVHDRDRVEHVDLINLVFRVLELRGVLIPQDPQGYDRCPMIIRDPNYNLVADHPDVYYIHGHYTGSHLPDPSPRGYFRDMLKYACSNEQHSLLKSLLATLPGRFEGGRRPSLQDNNEIKCSAEAVNLEAVRVLLTADRDWKLGTDPTGWPLAYLEYTKRDLEETLENCFADDEDLSDYTDMHTIQGLLIQDRRNI